MRNAMRAKNASWLSIVGPMLLPMTAFAQPLVLEAQASSVPQAAVGTTDAAPASVPLTEVKDTGGKILVLPFQPVNPNDASPWLGKSIQESMVADLTVAAPNRVVAVDQPAATLEAAIAVGKQNGARYVIAGGFVTVDRDFRITGQVVDVESGKPVAGLKATGDPSQIFRMEDALALQVRGQVLGQHVTMPQAAPAEQSPAQEQQQPPAPSIVSAPPLESAQDVGGTPPAGPEYSSYATAPEPVVYGGSSTPYGYYPSYSTTYVGGYDPYYYPASYSYAPFYSCDYGYYGGCAPFGLGLGFYFGTGFSHSHFGYGRGYGYGYRGGYNGYNYAYRGNYVGGGRTSLGVTTNLNVGLRGAGVRGSIGLSAGSVRSAARVGSSGTPFRSSAFYQTASFGRSSSIGGFHASGGFSSHASFGGSGGFHGGGGISHGSGSSHGGGSGGHR